MSEPFKKGDHVWVPVVVENIAGANARIKITWGNGVERHAVVPKEAILLDEKGSSSVEGLVTNVQPHHDIAGVFGIRLTLGDKTSTALTVPSEILKPSEGKSVSAVRSL